jgi:hypothetical protein
MSLEEEFEAHYARFHEYMSRSQVLLNLYPKRNEMNTVKTWVDSVPTSNECIIELLGIEDRKVIEVFENWRNPSETSAAAEEILEKQVGGHLIADIAYLFWKYCDVVDHVTALMKGLRNRVLLEQALVCACTAYECFSREMIPWILRNDRESAKRFLGSLTKPVKELGKYDFDPIKNVDKIFSELYEKRFMPVFPDVMDFYNATLRIELFRSKRGRKYMEKIFQMRHCIVHNEGKPDERWKRTTRNAQFRIDRRTVARYCVKVHEKLHDAAWQIFEHMDLDMDKSPWTSAEGEGRSDVDVTMVCDDDGKWKYIGDI